LQLLGAIKGCFMGSVFEFFPVPSVTAVIVLARSSQGYPSVAPKSQWGFGITEVRISTSMS
jgi:hypothetical protein